MQLEERIIRYLAKCPPAISHSGGDEQTFKVACALYNGFALDEAETLRFLKVYNETCQPPWKEKVLRHKAKEATKAAHEKPRGHLLGQSSLAVKTAFGREPKPVPVRRRGEKADLGRLGRSPIPLAPNACARTHIMQLRKVCSVPTVPDAETQQNVAPTGPQPSQPSQIENESKAPPSGMSSPPEDDGMVVVPGCRVRRPVEIEMADDDWRALDESGFAEEPMVQLAAWMFGPCTVLETEGAQ